MTEQKNLQSIQRIDSSACEVILHCTQAALYEFNQAGNKWKDTDTTGPLFVYRRRDFPFYAIMIANRQSLEDHIEPIVDNLSFIYEPPYILINRADGMIRGIWVFGEDECKRIFNKIDKIHQLVAEGRGGISELEHDQEKEKENSATTSNNRDSGNVVTINKIQNEDVSTTKNNKEKDNNNVARRSPKEIITPRNKTQKETAILKNSSEKEEIVARSNNQQKEIATPTRSSNSHQKEIITAKTNSEKEMATAGTSRQKENLTKTVCNNQNERVARLFDDKLAILKKSPTPVMAKTAETSKMSTTAAALTQQVKTLQNIVLTLTMRIDPFACELIAYFQQGTLYEFSIEENQWKKTDTTGPLVIFRRMDFPNYSLLVIDQKMKNDFVQPLDEKLKIEHRGPYVFLSGRSDGVIISIWMPSTDECARIYKTLIDLMEEEFGNIGDAVILEN